VLVHVAGHEVHAVDAAGQGAAIGRPADFTVADDRYAVVNVHLNETGRQKLPSVSIVSPAHDGSESTSPIAAMRPDQTCNPPLGANRSGRINVAMTIATSDMKQPFVAASRSLKLQQSE
jgi:hypothetical protein